MLFKGNLFGCGYNGNKDVHSKSFQYHCGSFDLDVTISIWCTMLALIVLTATLVLVVTTRQDLATYPLLFSLLKLYNQFGKWEKVGKNDEILKNIPNTGI